MSLVADRSLPPAAALPGGALPGAPAPLVVEAVALTKLYRRGTEAVRALDGVSFEIARGEFVAVVGPSGAG